MSTVHDGEYIGALVLFLALALQVGCGSQEEPYDGEILGERGLLSYELLLYEDPPQALSPNMEALPLQIFAPGHCERASSDHSCSREVIVEEARAEPKAIVRLVEGSEEFALPEGGVILATGEATGEGRLFVKARLSGTSTVVEDVFRFPVSEPARAEIEMFCGAGLPSVVFFPNENRLRGRIRVFDAADRRLVGVGRREGCPLRSLGRSPSYGIVSCLGEEFVLRVLSAQGEDRLTVLDDLALLGVSTIPMPRLEIAFRGPDRARWGIDLHLSRQRQGAEPVQHDNLSEARDFLGPALPAGEPLPLSAGRLYGSAWLTEQGRRVCSVAPRFVLQSLSKSVCQLSYEVVELSGRWLRIEDVFRTEPLQRFELELLAPGRCELVVESRDVSVAAGGEQVDVLRKAVVFEVE